MKIKFRAKYLFVFAGILLTEVWIALFVNDQIIRPFVGDLLVILLMYAFVRVFIEPRNHVVLAVCLLVFAYLVEIGQYFELVSRLGLADLGIARIVIGTSFDWVDFLAYTIGFMIVIVSGIRRGTDRNQQR
jgi:hypothetical protein